MPSLYWFRALVPDDRRWYPISVVKLQVSTPDHVDGRFMSYLKEYQNWIFPNHNHKSFVSLIALILDNPLIVSRLQEYVWYGGVEVYWSFLCNDYKYYGSSFAQWISIIEFCNSLTYGVYNLMWMFDQHHWYGEFHNSIIKTHNSYMDLHIRCSTRIRFGSPLCFGRDLNNSTTVKHLRHSCT